MAEDLPPSVAQSPLFNKLPPELRSRIFEFAVYSSEGSGRCEVTRWAGIPEPALLLTCKIIRKEAIGIFYAENEFVLVIRAFNPAPLLLLSRKEKMLAASHGYGIPNVYQGVDSMIYYVRRWVNLLSWLRYHHTGEASALLEMSHSHLGVDFGMYVDEADFIGTMFKLAAATRGVPGGKVKDIIDGLRHGLIALHYDWEE